MALSETKLKIIRSATSEFLEKEIIRRQKGIGTGSPEHNSLVIKACADELNRRDSLKGN